MTIRTKIIELKRPKEQANIRIIETWQTIYLNKYITITNYINYLMKTCIIEILSISTLRNSHISSLVTHAMPCSKKWNNDMSIWTPIALPSGNSLTRLCNHLHGLLRESKTSDSTSKFAWETGPFDDLSLEFWLLPCELPFAINSIDRWPSLLAWVGGFFGLAVFGGAFSFLMICKVNLQKPRDYEKTCLLKHIGNVMQNRKAWN